MKNVQRISVSIPEKTYRQLEEIIEAENWKNRSKIITKLIHDKHVEVSETFSDTVMAGSITLFYNEDHRNILKDVSEVERENIDEVISSHRVLLENNHIMELLVVQGRVRKLKEIQNQLIKIKGVETGKLTLTSTVLPPIQAKEEDHNE